MTAVDENKAPAAGIDFIAVPELRQLSEQSNLCDTASDAGRNGASVGFRGGS